VGRRTSWAKASAGGSSPESGSLARAVLETLEGSEAARCRAQAGREYVLRRHSSDRLVRDVDALYRDLRSAKKAA
jgi:hypothetical protein